jgi:two-component system, LuxR family, sensor kinase FixL
MYRGAPELNLTGPLAWNLRTVIGTLLYLALYLTLDWISIIQPVGPLGMTPWNPSAGLSFALLLVYGVFFVPAYFIALLVADILFRDLAITPLVTLVSALAIALGYSVAAWVLRQRVGMSLRLSSQRDLLCLLAAALVAPAIIALPMVLLFGAAGIMSWTDAGAAFLHFWVGDVIAIAVLTPFLLLMVDRERRAQGLHHPTPAEPVLQLAAIILSLWIMFGFEPSNHFEYSYLLFLPLIWIALRSGLSGATWGIVATQIGLVAAIHLKGYGADILAQFQLLMLAVAVTGLILGAAVDDRQRAELNLREHGADLAHASRLTTSGELAASLAHELNQPLTALVSFARACQTILRSPGAAEETARGEAAALIDRAVQQATRAGEIIRTTRELLRGGSVPREKVAPELIVRAALDLSRVDAVRQYVRIVTRIDPTTPDVFADPIQVEQVLLNLLRNGIEAIAQDNPPTREIELRVRPAEDGRMVEFIVHDTGLGISAEIGERLFKPFASTKATGMGLGLSISRSIIEAHGGRIWTEPGRPGAGADFRFTVPVYMEERNGN